SRYPGQVRRGRYRPQERWQLTQLPGECRLVPPYRGVKRQLVGGDDLLLVAGLDGEVDTSQIRARRALGISCGHRDLRRVLGRGRLHWTPRTNRPQAEHVQFVQREGVRAGGRIAVPCHARRPGGGRVLEVRIGDHVGAYVIVHRLDASQRPGEHRVIEVHHDVQAL